MHTAIITGSTGFIGTSLIQYLADKDIEIYAITRPSSKRMSNIPRHHRVHIIECALDNLSNCYINIPPQNELDCVFYHLGWDGATGTFRNDQALQEKNVIYSLDAVRLAHRIGCTLFVDAGSQAEYGIVQSTITEDTPCKPFSAYGKAKLQMYYENRKLTQQLGMKYIHLRILSVYGEQDHPNTLVISSMRKLQANEPIDMRSGGQKWNYVYVKDAARQIAELSAFAFSNDNFHYEVYNIASNDTRQLQDFVTVMKDICQSSSILNFGGYDPEKDVNLNPDMTKTAGIVQPLTEYQFEEIIRNMTSIL